MVLQVILRLLEMEKNKIAVLIGCLQAAAASLLAVLQLYRTLRENWEFKGSTTIYSLPLISKLNSQYFCFRT